MALAPHSKFILRFEILPTMIRVPHPDKLVRLKQQQYLKNCSPDLTSFWELHFSHGNAITIYFAKRNEITLSNADFLEWLETLPK